MKMEWEFLAKIFMHNQKGQMLEESTMNRQGPIKEFLPGPKSQSWDKIFKFDSQASTISTWLSTTPTCHLWDQLPPLLMEWGEFWFVWSISTDISYLAIFMQINFNLKQVAARWRGGCRQDRLPWFFFQGDPVWGDPSKRSDYFLKDMIATPFFGQCILNKMWHCSSHLFASSCKLFLSSSLPSFNAPCTFQALQAWVEPFPNCFPDSFNCWWYFKVATMETLSYYGARFVEGEANCNATFQMTDRCSLSEISTKLTALPTWTFLGLMCRQIMDDMTYNDNFFSKWVNRSGGGPTLEWIDSPNLDCPLTRY